MQVFTTHLGGIVRRRNKRLLGGYGIFMDIAKCTSVESKADIARNYLDLICGIGTLSGNYVF